MQRAKSRALRAKSENPLRLALNPLPSVRWSEAIERNEAYEVFSAAC
jgi:hypothetical protein